MEKSDFSATPKYVKRYKRASLWFVLTLSVILVGAIVFIAFQPVQVRNAFGESALLVFLGSLLIASSIFSLKYKIIGGYYPPINLIRANLRFFALALGQPVQGESGLEHPYIIGTKAKIYSVLGLVIGVVSLGFGISTYKQAYLQSIVALQNSQKVYFVTNPLSNPIAITTFSYLLSICILILALYYFRLDISKAPSRLKAIILKYFCVAFLTIGFFAALKWGGCYRADIKRGAVTTDGYIQSKQYISDRQEKIYPVNKCTGTYLTKAYTITFIDDHGEEHLVAVSEEMYEAISPYQRIRLSYFQNTRTSKAMVILE